MAELVTDTVSLATETRQNKTCFWLLKKYKVFLSSPGWP